MFASILGQVTGQLEKRFLLNVFFPTLVFALLMGLVVVSVTTGVDEAVDAWGKEPSVVQVLLVIGGVATVFVVANVVSVSMLTITRLFEGYAPPARWLGRGGRRVQMWRRGHVSEDDQLSRFPLPRPGAALTRKDFAPTRLGNTLRNSETYPLARYGVDPVRTWPYLYQLIDEKLKASLDDARASMELLLVVAFWAGLFSPIAGGFLLFYEASTGWVLAATLGGAGLSLLAYQAALAPAQLYGNHVRTAFDMHRLKLFTSLGLPAPATVGEERLVWPWVVDFLADPAKPDHTWRYVREK